MTSIAPKPKIVVAEQTLTGNVEQMHRSFWDWALEIVTLSLANTGPERIFAQAKAQGKKNRAQLERDYGNPPDRQRLVDDAFNAIRSARARGDIAETNNDATLALWASNAAQGLYQGATGKSAGALAVSTKALLSVVSADGVAGAEGRIPDQALEGDASKGNNFARFTDAETVARHLAFPTAIVASGAGFALYRAPGVSPALGGRVVSVVSAGAERFNSGYQSPPRQRATSAMASITGDRIMVNGAPYTIAGIDVYDLADVAARNDTELAKTLQAIAATGANTVRCMTFSKHDPATFARILDTSKALGLDLKFIFVLGNQWADCEAAGIAEKNDAWYKSGYKTAYLPHVLATVAALKDRPEILSWELVNEPQGDHTTLRNFADDVSTQVRAIAPQIISLGTFASPTTPGMITATDYSDLYSLPNIDIATAHDYKGDETIDLNHAQAAASLGKPFFLGEIGVRVRTGGTESNPTGPTLRTPQKALEIIEHQLSKYAPYHISGALIWGPQPLGHAVDGGGYGVTFAPGDPFELAFSGLLSRYRAALIAQK